MTATPGERLFARYAHAPNALGYCGPASATVLRQAAVGLPVASDDIRRVARQFSGAWPYQQLMGELTGLDPLSVEVGRAYWTGSALNEQIDANRLGALLLERLGPQAGHYWSHLTPDLLAEVTPTHAFHVLGVYPWTRLLPIDPAAALGVLDGCRIRAGRVLEAGERLIVEAQSLTWDGARLALGATHTEEAIYTATEGALIEQPRAGELVALHWGSACDRLTEQDASHLTALTDRQIALTNRRIARESAT